MAFELFRTHKWSKGLPELQLQWQIHQLIQAQEQTLSIQRRKLGESVLPWTTYTRNIFPHLSEILQSSISVGLDYLRNFQGHDHNWQFLGLFSCHTRTVFRWELRGKVEWMHKFSELALCRSREYLTNYHNYYISASLWKIWLVKSIQSINNYWMRSSKISYFVSGELINYLPKPKAEANNLSARHWLITIFCGDRVQ